LRSQAWHELAKGTGFVFVTRNQFDCPKAGLRRESGRTFRGHSLREALQLQQAVHVQTMVEFVLVVAGQPMTEQQQKQG